MTRSFWNGKGELPDDAVAFTTSDGALRGRPYLRLRAVRKLSYYARLFSAAERHRIIAETIDNDEWLAPYNGALVSAICRDVVNVLYCEGALREQPLTREIERVD